MRDGGQAWWVRACLAVAVVTAASHLAACARGHTADDGGAANTSDTGVIFDGPVADDGYPPKPVDVPAASDGAGVGACGLAGRACCDASPCGAGLACTAGVCAEALTCGALDQPCCAGTRCGPGLSCTAGQCAALSDCGGSGQACCSMEIPCVGRQVCGESTCRPCGGAGEPCCGTTPPCNSSLACAAGWCARS